MKAINLGSRKVLSTVLKLIIPAMIAQFINVLYSIVDRMYVGNIEGIGDTALAAVGVCAPITTLISSFAFLIGTGGAPIFAMALGEGREDNAKKILSNAAYALVVLAVIVAAGFQHNSLPADMGRERGVLRRASGRHCRVHSFEHSFLYRFPQSYTPQGKRRGRFEKEEVPPPQAGGAGLIFALVAPYCRTN